MVKNNVAGDKENQDVFFSTWEVGESCKSGKSQCKVVANPVRYESVS